MEQRGIGHLVLALVFCAASAAFAYSMGHQAGERDMRDVMERSALEHRLATILNHEHDLYEGDLAYEDDGSEAAEPAAEDHASAVDPDAKDSAARASGAKSSTIDSATTSALP